MNLVENRINVQHYPVVCSAISETIIDNSISDAFYTMGIALIRFMYCIRCLYNGYSSNTFYELN